MYIITLLEVRKKVYITDVTKQIKSQLILLHTFIFSNRPTSNKHKRREQASVINDNLSRIIFRYLRMF